MARVCTLVGVAGAASLVATLAVGPVTSGRAREFAFFVVVLGALQVVPLRLFHEEQGENLQLEEALFIPMVLFLTPSETVGALALAVAFGQLVRRRDRARFSFNVGMIAVSATVGVTVARLLGAHRLDTSVPALVAAAVGGLAFTALSAVFVALIIHLAEGVAWRTTLGEGAGVRVATWVGSLSLGVLVAIAALARGWALIVVVVPVAVLQLSYANALRQWQERRRVEALYEATGSVRASIDPDEVRHRLLGAARRLLHASDAELIPVSDAAPPSDALRADVTPSLRLSVRGRVGGGPWDPHDERVLRTLAAVAAGALENARLFAELRTITASLGEGLVALDGDGRVTYVNPALERMLGCDEAELVGRDFHDTVHGEEAVAARGSCPLATAVRRNESTTIDEETLQRGDGSQLPVSLSVSPVRRDGAPAGGVVVAVRDLSERRAFEEQLSFHALHDPLTGLPNRRLLMERIRHAQSRGRRNAEQQPLFLIDLDRFKLVNDSIGHDAGDELLIAAAERIGHCLRPGDTLARFGGDEFVALVEGAPDLPVTAIADTILETLRRPFFVHGHEIFLSASIGIVADVRDEARAEHLLRDADVAMIRAKASGSSRYEMFDPTMGAGVRDRLDLEAALRQALDHRQFELHYQPVYSVATGTIVGAEALLRWNHPERGLVGPGLFIQVAEETGLIVPIGHWALHSACLQVARWHALLREVQLDGDEPFFVSVNLSGRQFQEAGLKDEVADVLATTGVDPTTLHLEITESVIMEQGPATIAALEGLRSLGVRLVIDDFGTGYSSLSYLKRFPVNTLKIDKSFVDDVADSDTDAAIVEAVIGLAQAVGMRVVAEGVERREQLDRLAAMGCELVQGYYLARPQPVERVSALLLAQATGDPSLAGNARP